MRLKTEQQRKVQLRRLRREWSEYADRLAAREQESYFTEYSCITRDEYVMLYIDTRYTWYGSRVKP